MHRGPLCLLVAAALVVAGCGGGGGEPSRSGSSSPSLPPPAAGQASGRALHVSPEGSDAGSGSRLSPLRSIQHALDLARPGDAVLLEPGSYPEAVTIERGGTAAAPVRLAARVEGEAVVTGRVKIAADNVVVSGLVVVGQTDANPEDVALYVSGGRSVRLVGNEIRRAAQSGIFVGEAAADVRIERNWIHLNGRDSFLDHGIYIESSNAGLIANNLIEANAGFGIQLYPNADGFLVTQNTIVRNGRAGVIVGGELATADDNLIVNNVVAMNGGEGIRTYWGAGQGSGNEADTNLVYGNDGDGEAQVDGLAVRGTIEESPGFADSGNGDYGLGPDSPALDSALEEYALPTDKDGVTRPQGAGPDLGAFERPDGAG